MPPIRRSNRIKIKPEESEQTSKSTSIDHDDDDEMMTGKTRQVGMSAFPYTLPYKRLNLRELPHLYRPGKGEQGVLMVEPYKSELLPNWTFKNPDSARKSSQNLRNQFDQYLEQNDFIGADMARKFIQVRVCT